MRTALLAGCLSTLLVASALSQSIFDDTGTDAPAQNSARAADRPLVPLPDAAAVKSATGLLHDTFGEEIKNARTIDQKKSLVKKLTDSAAHETGAARYVLLTTARNMAIDAGDIEGCDAALDGLESTFAVDSQKERLDAYLSLARNVAPWADWGRFCRDISQTLRAAVEVDRFDIAKADADLGLRIARKSDDADLEKQAAADAQWVRLTQEAYAALTPSLTILAHKPNDPGANLKMGRYRCFLKGNWRGGLPMLAKGDDATLKTVAALELASSTAVEDQVKIADGWWEVADKLTGPQKIAVQAHAAQWYGAAAKSLEGLAKMRAQKRIDEANAAGSHSSGGNGVSSFLIEALIDGNSELHITPTGIYWVENGAAKPGRWNGANDPTLVNGKEWWPKWHNPGEERGDDSSEPLPLSIGKSELDYEIVAITAQRGERGIAHRDDVKLNKAGDEYVLSIPDTQVGAMWYAIRLSKVQMTELKRQCVGKWYEPTLRCTVTLGADGAVTTSPNINSGTWGASADGTVIEVRWKNDGWIHFYKSVGGKWFRTGYQYGIQKTTVSIVPQ